MFSDEATPEELTTTDRPAHLLHAALVGPTRPIDNAVLLPPGVAAPDHLRELPT